MKFRCVSKMPNLLSPDFSSISRDILFLVYVKNSVHDYEYLQVISMESRLAILKGPKDEKSMIISSVPYSIGRCRTANFIIPHVNVSRNHCEIVIENGLWQINDFSTTGTFVNQKLIGKGKSAILNSGDDIRLGPIEVNLCWSFHLLTHSIENGISLGVNSQRETVLELSNNNSHLKESPCTSAVINVNNKVKENTHDEQKVKQESDLQSTKTVCEGKLIKTEENIEMESNKIAEELVKKENLITMKEENSESKKIEELTKELQQVQNALNNLEEKNKKLAEEARNNSETSAPSNLVENLTDLLETELQCTICSELFVIAVTLSCTHTFCKYCINLWKKKQKTCPICRKKITNETRSLVVDNYIDKMVENLSSELKLKRQAIIKERNEVETVKKRSKIKN